MCLTVYPLNALSKDKREIEITSIGMKFVYIPSVEESIVFDFLSLIDFLRNRHLLEPYIRLSNTNALYLGYICQSTKCL